MSAIFSMSVFFPLSSLSAQVLKVVRYIRYTYRVSDILTIRAGTSGSDAYLMC